MSLEEIKDLSDIPEPIQSLSAEKYGKAAYVELTYTPRKIKDNLLYIQAMTMKKQQEKSNQLREIKAQNEMLHDRVEKLKTEKEGIEDSLNQQINMYKKLISEMQSKYEQKIKSFQSQFSSQMKIVIQQREQNAKVAQAQKQQLQDQIERLKRNNSALENKLAEAKKVIETLNYQRQKLHLSQKQISFELQEAKQLKKAHQGKAKNQNQQLKKKMFQAQQKWKTTMHEAILQKQKQIDNIKRQSLQDLSKLEQKASADNQLKNSQIQIVTKTFNSQFQRLNQKLNERQKMIQNLNKQLNEQKEKFLQSTRAYDKLVNGLIYEKNRLETDKDILKVDNIRMLQREKVLAFHPIGVGIQFQKLKELLLESYNQLSQCKQELVNLDKQRSDLLVQLNIIGQENQVLRRSRRW